MLASLGSVASIEIARTAPLMRASAEARKPIDATQTAPSLRATSETWSPSCSISRMPGANAAPSFTSSCTSWTVARLLATGSMIATIGTSLPPKAFQLFTFPVNRSLSCSFDRSFTGFALLTYTARPS